MTDDHLPRPERLAWGAFVRRFPQVHLGVGLLGSGLFVAGTVLLMAQQRDAGLWFFLVGSIGMLVGNLGELVRELGKRRLDRRGIDPFQADDA